MNDLSSGKIKALPGRDTSMGVSLAPSTRRDVAAVRTTILPFEVVKPFLSNKPLRRPNRVKPLP